MANLALFSDAALGPPPGASARAKKANPAPARSPASAAATAPPTRPQAPPPTVELPPLPCAAAGCGRTPVKRLALCAPHLALAPPELRAELLAAEAEDLAARGARPLRTPAVALAAAREIARLEGAGAPEPVRVAFSGTRRPPRDAPEAEHLLFAEIDRDVRGAIGALGPHAIVVHGDEPTGVDRIAR